MIMVNTDQLTLKERPMLPSPKLHPGGRRPGLESGLPSQATLRPLSSLTFSILLHQVEITPTNRMGEGIPEPFLMVMGRV